MCQRITNLSSNAAVLQCVVVVVNRCVW
jgi:hypothetical protein